MTERSDKITAEFVPAPPVPPPPDKVVVRAPLGTNKYPIFPDLHLSIEQAWELRAALDDALMEGELRAESRLQVNSAD